MQSTVSNDNHCEGGLERLTKKFPSEEIRLPCGPSPCAWVRLYGTLRSFTPWKSITLIGVVGTWPKPSRGAPDTGPMEANRSVL